jgi:GT2 family glycosyltransferase
MTTVLVTVQRGRRKHLERQLAAVAASERRPRAHVVVSMDRVPPSMQGCDVVWVPTGGSALPVAAARNIGIEHARRRYDADLTILLDVDCLPSPAMIGRYEAAFARRQTHVLSGPVWYLPPGVPAAGALPTPAELAGLGPHAARPAPEAGALQDEPRHELFWSLSFAVSPPVHARIGGFDERYVGYGAEDTDYAQRASAAGVGLTWVGGADAYHQHHPVSSPPVEHLSDIVRNAALYRSIWGAWPMHGWLQAFARDGLVEWLPDGERLGLTPKGEAAAQRTAN